MEFQAQFFKNAYTSNFVGSLFDFSANNGFSVNSFEGAVASGVVGGKLNILAGKFTGYASSNFRLNISSLKLNNTSSITNPIASSVSVGLHSFSNTMSNLSQSLRNEISKDN